MNPNPQQLERIVAYLDGELSPEESAQVEQQLASDEQFRQELQSAQRAWSALDELTMAHVGEDFSRTTMEMVVDAAKLDVQAQTIAMPIQKRKRKTVNLLLIATTVLLGALAARIVAQNPNRKLLADLPIIHNVDIYSQFEDVEFLRTLHANLGDKVTTYSLDKEELQANLEEAKLIAVSSNRQQWVQSLSADQQTTLRGKYNRFSELPADKRDSMRALHTQIESDDESEQLLATLHVYQQWLNELEPSEQYELRELSPERRAIRAADEIQLAAKNHSFELTPDELKNLFEKVQPFVQNVISRHEQDFERTFEKRSRQDRKRFDSLGSRKKSTLQFVHAMRSSPEYFREFIDTVTDALPEHMRDEFWQLHPGERQETVFGWFRQYHAQASGVRRSGQVTEQELSDFFVEVLDADEKERLLAMPREEMQRQLRRMYLFKMPQSERGGPPGMRDGRPPLRDGTPNSRNLRGRRDDDRPEGGRRARTGMPSRGERGGPPRFDGEPEGPRRNFDRQPGRPIRENGDRDGPPRRRRPEDESQRKDPRSEEQPPAENL